MATKTKSVTTGAEFKKRSEAGKKAAITRKKNAAKKTGPGGKSIPLPRRFFKETAKKAAAPKRKTASKGPSKKRYNQAESAPKRKNVAKKR